MWVGNAFRKHRAAAALILDSYWAVWNQSLIVQKNTTDYDLAKEVQKTAQEQQILQMTFKQAME